MLEIGTTFKVNSSQYRSRKDVFTVVKIEPTHHADIVCKDAHGDTMCFSSTALEQYGITVISQPVYKTSLMKQAVSQTLSSFIMFAEGETNGGRRFDAVMKADEVIGKGADITFNGTQLIFTSPFSNKKRIVTKNGCSDQCDCKNQMSYHKALFAIFQRYTELTTEKNVKAFPVREKVATRRAA